MISFKPTEEQELIRDTLREFATGELREVSRPSDEASQIPSELLEKVWGREYIDDVYYPRVYVSQLRRKIEPDPASPIYILTEHRVGYRFERQDDKG